MSPVKYELGFHIPEDGIPHSHRRENPNSGEIMFSEEASELNRVGH
jgi:hypothetical protein